MRLVLERLIRLGWSVRANPGVLCWFGLTLLWVAHAQAQSNRFTLSQRANSNVRKILNCGKQGAVAFCVRVDQMAQFTGWSYDAESNSIVFDWGHIPAEGTTIEVEYTPLPPENKD